MSSQQLKVSINKIAHRKENGWSILLTDYGKCIGTIEFDIEVGDCLELDGSFEISKHDGSKQFDFTNAQISFPTESRALLKYAIDITIGLGPAKEKDIWEKYGESWEFQQELVIKGVSPKINSNWQDTLKRINEKRDMVKVITYIRSKGFSLNVGQKAWEEWQVPAISHIEKNPYKLAELRGQSFNTIDEKIVENFEVEPAYRLKSALLYILNNKTNGDTVMTLEDVTYWLSTYSITIETERLIKLFESLHGKEICWLKKFELVALGKIATDEIVIYNYFKGE